MKCNPLSWLWGLLPLALVAWVAWLAEMPRIEQDLATRSAAALAQKGLSWAVPQFSGRDGVVTGRAVDDSEQKLAATTVASVWGVQSVTDKSGVVELIKPYTWSAASTTDSALRLAGHVPSEAVRRDVVAAAKAAFPNHKIDDQMKLGRGAPELARWMGGVTFGLKQLAQLKNGAHADLDVLGLTVTGEADNANTFKAVRTALASQLPTGVSLKSEKIAAPLAKPYTWAASLSGRQVELTGHAPSERVQSQVLAEAKKAFPNATVVDHMILGSGEPADWHKVVSTSLSRLAQLTEGKADLRDTALTLTGYVQREETVEAVRRALKAEIPVAFKVEEKIQQDPKIKAEEEARRAATAAETARRAAEAAKRAADEDAAKQLSAEETAKRAAAAEAARRAAADEAARRAATEAEAKRVADLRRQQEDEQARRKAAEEAAAKAAAEAGTRQRTAAAEAQRLAEQTAVRQREVASRCQDELRSAAKAGAINFQRASAEIERVSFGTLDKLAVIAKTCPDATIEIEGHTDAEGEPARNQRLSERRARSVADYLVKAGVPDQRVAPVGHGDTQPIAPNTTPEDRARNRRIEFNVKAK